MNRKFLFGMAIGCSVLLLTGCGNSDGKKEEKKNGNTQVISCTYTENEEDFGTATNTITFEYDKSKKEYTKGISKSDMNIENDELVELYQSIDLCGGYEENEENKNLIKTCDSKTDGKNISLTIEYNLDELEKNDKNKLKFQKNMTPDELVASMEKSQEGIKCTIK